MAGDGRFVIVESDAALKSEGGMGLLWYSEKIYKKEKNIQECAELKSGIPLISIKTSDGFTNLNFSVNNHTIKGYYNIPKFENRGIKLGHGVWDMVFTRK